MQPGDLVIHTPSKKRLTVKSTAGGLVHCGWIETNSRGEQVEASAAFDWQELRSPTEQEKAGIIVTDDSEADLAESEPHKKKGK